MKTEKVRSGRLAMRMNPTFEETDDPVVQWATGLGKAKAKAKEELPAASLAPDSTINGVGS